MKASVDISSNISLWIARQHRHVKMSPYYLCTLFGQERARTNPSTIREQWCWIYSHSWQICHVLLLSSSSELLTFNSPVHMCCDSSVDSGNPESIWFSGYIYIWLPGCWTFSWKKAIIILVISSFHLKNPIVIKKGIYFIQFTLRWELGLLNLLWIHLSMQISYDNVLCIFSFLNCAVTCWLITLDPMEEPCDSLHSFIPRRKFCGLTDLHAW